MSGLYNYKKTVLMVMIGLIYERQCINWLKNRFGCTHFKFQKFIELDIRRNCLRYNWPNPEYCKYNIDNYKKHYFSNDFDQIKNKIEENITENPDIKLDEYGRKPIGDFIPVKIAKRLRNSIEFSVKLNLRCPEIKIDDKTLAKMKEADL